MYSYYNKKSNVENVHLPAEGHDFGFNKRTAIYDFMARYLHLDRSRADESKITIEKMNALYVFGDHAEKLPAYAIHGFDQLEKLWNVSR